MARLRDWIDAARPKTLIAILSPICLGSMVGFIYGHFEWTAFLWMALGGLSLQFLLNFSNDYYDCKQGFDTTERIGPIRMCASGVICLKKMRFAMMCMQLVMALALWGLFSRGGIPFVWLALLAWLLAIGYSKKPLCLSQRGLGEIFVFIFFGPVATSAAAYTHLATIPIETLYLGAGCGFLSTAILAAANIRDIQEDSHTGKHTFAVRFGIKAAKIEISLLLIAALAISLFVPGCAFALIGLLLPLSTLLKAVYHIQTPKDAVSLMPKTALFLTLYTVGLSLCLWKFFGQQL